jgi:hypothetical protein
MFFPEYQKPSFTSIENYDSQFCLQYWPCP